jgi:hypothetical protein
MSWKKYIFTEDAEASTSKGSKETPKQEARSFSQFPSGEGSKVESTETKTVQTPTPTAEVVVTPQTAACEPHMDKILNMYETGFDGLNMDGYDFFEFYQAILSSSKSSEAFKMAFNMAQSMDSSITKEKLVEQAKHYVDEVTKVHTNYQKQGAKKRESLMGEKESKRQTLSDEVQKIDQQIAQLSAQKTQKQTELLQIDSKYQPTLVDIDCKLMANDEAKNRLVNSINSVLTGINTNL